MQDRHYLVGTRAKNDSASDASGRFFHAMTPFIIWQSLKTHPESALHPVFKSRLMQIAAELQNNRTKQAWYSAQLLVREYGTHIVTSVDAGATLVQETHIKESVIKDNSLIAHDVKVASSATFFSALTISAGFRHRAVLLYYKVNAIRPWKF